MSLIERVEDAFREALHGTGQAPLRSPLVVGVSGGPDSAALLHSLRQIVPADLLVVAHLDHGLRPGSAAEAEFVAGLAGDLSFQSARVEIAERARARGLSIEEAGREARYEFLAHVAREVGATAVVVGHNADDQVETILMHLLRGSGPAGLRGMRPVSPLPGHAGLWLLRPLLGLGRAEIEAYCAQHELSPITDASNADLTFFRNQIRHELLPLLEQYNPQIRQRLVDMAAAIAAEDDLLMHLAGRVWEDAVLIDRGTVVALDKGAWRESPLALRRRVLRLALSQVEPTPGDVGFRALESARRIAESGNTDARAALPGGLTLVVDYDRLIIRSGAAEQPADAPQVPTLAPILLAVPGTIELADGWQITAKAEENADARAISANRDPWTAYVAFDAGTPLVVRARHEGERMRPFGLGGQTKIKKIMIDRKIPARLRERWPIVACPEHALWIIGHVLDERARVRPQSAYVVRLHCRQPGVSEAG
jgi:tRNA(Ile)-lysidine synthase